jgi:hypothetical protein
MTSLSSFPTPQYTSQVSLFCKEKISCLFLAVLRFEFRASQVLIRQVLYHLSHASSPFCCGYFGDRVSLPRLV